MAERSNHVAPQRHRVFLIIAALLLVLVGLLVGAAGLALLLGGPDTGEEIVAGDTATYGMAVVLLVTGVALILAGVAALLRRRAAWRLGVAALVAAVAVGFVSNYVLFGSLRPAHTGTNVLVAALVMWLLSKGRPALRSTA